MGIEFCNLDPCCTMHRHGMEKSLQGHQNKMNKGLQLSKSQSENYDYSINGEANIFVFVDCCSYADRLTELGQLTIA